VSWDCENKEYVLIFPTVFTLLGDNPMQSEMACHIGLQGKTFCRACIVNRHESAPPPDANQPQHLDSNSRPTTPRISTTPTRPSFHLESEDEAVNTGRPHDSDISEVGSDVPRAGSKKKKETMGEMVVLTSFLQVCSSSSPPYIS
jgi:hypothetical protein